MRADRPGERCWCGARCRYMDGLTAEYYDWEETNAEPDAEPEA